MNFIRKNWYYIGGVLCVVLGATLALHWNDISTLRRLMLVSLMALQLHQLEEYAWPGGFPAVFNLAVHPTGSRPDRCPLNRLSVLVVNWGVAYLFYAFGIYFSHVIWLGLGVVLVGMAQLGFHGVFVARKMRTLYNPGLFTSAFLFWPIGIYYIWYVVSNGLVQWWMWPVAVVIFVVVAVFGVNGPIALFKNENSPYPFSEEEMARFQVREKMERQNAKKT